MIKLYGHSDDCIEIDGDLREEFYYNHDPFYLGFSDGTVMGADYRFGLWKFDLVKTGKAVLTKHEATDAETDYSDIVTLDDTEEPIRWIIAGEHMIRRK